MQTIGKKIFDDLYIHISEIRSLQDVMHVELINNALKTIEFEQSRVNVVKLNIRSCKVSLLEYEHFESDPFPALLGSWLIEPNSDKFSYRTYKTSLNPPILHRKELLVSSAHPEFNKWCNTTSEAELLGLFENVRIIGFKKNWERLIASKGYELNGSTFSPIGNVLEEFSEESENSNGHVARHLTALNRTALSAPVQLLIKHGLLSEGSSFFDYGCGRGTDLNTLQSAGIESAGWDPHYAPENSLANADVVNLGFVVNVIEDSAERIEAISKAHGLAKKVLAVSVMLYGPGQPGKPYLDGYLTSRNTFQKYFSQGELKDYLEHALGQQVFMVGPGIAFIFTDKEFEQQFNSRRFRSNDLTERLLTARFIRTNSIRSARVRIARPSKSQAEFDSSKELLNHLWELSLDLGRYPEPIEVNFLPELSMQIPSYSRAVRLLRTHFDQSLLDISSKARADELLLYMASQQFEKRPPYKKLEARIQRDIKYFFNDYKSAQTAGLQLIMQAANPASILEACDLASSQGLGWIETNQSLQFHISLLERMPVLLRAYVGCGLVIWESMSDVHIVKIHIGSGKLSFLEFEDFDSTPLPLLKRRVKINLRTQDYDVFEYGSVQYPSTILYRKSNFMHEDMPGYAEQLSFDESLEACQVLKEETFGPMPNQLIELLEVKRKRVAGFEISPSNTIPDLDQTCGDNFSFRNFIECGETQRKLGIPNLPLNPETYNSLYKLATEVLDPLIDYFGSINLTYGFSSHDLEKKIAGRIEPKLDQHASHECNKKGQPICDRLGAAIDFVIEDEDMLEVAQWIATNCSFDRLYFYGKGRPIHVSTSQVPKKLVTLMLPSPNSGRKVPKNVSIEQFSSLKI